MDGKEGGCPKGVNAVSCLLWQRKFQLTECLQLLFLLKLKFCDREKNVSVSFG